MTKEELIYVRDQELSDYYSELMDASGSIRIEAAAVPSRTDQRLAIGGRRRDNGEFDLVLRVQSIAGRGVSRAQEIIRRVRERFGEKQGIDFAVVRKISVPSQKAVAEVARRSLFGVRAKKPLSIGYSIGHQDGGPGTLGLFASARDGIAAVSCNHVLARVNEANFRDWIYQPGPPDVPADTQNRIGRLAHFRVLSRTGANRIDAAYCILESEIDICENVIPKESEARDAGHAFESVIDPFELDPGETIAKIGRTTGYTTEPVQNISVGINDVTIDIPGAGNHRFDDLIEIEWSDGRRPFARPGDSGSALYQEGRLAVFGLHMASGEIIRNRRRAIKVSYACPIKEVMDAYGLSLL